MGLSSLPPVAGLTYRRQYFAASSTFTLPTTGQNKFDAIIVSGGGGGGRRIYTGAYCSIGGSGAFLYAKDVYCTNGATLTVTIGAGGAGVTSGTTGTDGTASSISGLLGNGVSTSISSAAAPAGGMFAYNGTGNHGGVVSQVSSSIFIGTGADSDRNTTFGSGVGNFSRSSGNSHTGNPRTIFQTNTKVNYSSGQSTLMTTGSNTGGPIPLLGGYLHATAGATGTSGTLPGEGSTANTFFAGSGGGCRGSASYLGAGGGGGSGGRSTSGATIGGTGGNGSTNSGGGGGGGGINTTSGNTGLGGAGGSGFVIIGYWS